ncbi:MAG: hypothetical protein KME31_34385 [Tolypothrix carrinoi HA7290-LM1]|jgi:hypothetical protein|nr:hypothetical protein [Tolypothrix carrinoi HA7290-LM1]
MIDAAVSQGGTKFRRANTWTANIPLSELGITPECYKGYFKFNEYQVDGTTLREWWQSNFVLGTFKYFYKSNLRENTSPNAKYLWFAGDEIQWQKGDGKNCT